MKPTTYTLGYLSSPDREALIHTILVIQDLLNDENTGDICEWIDAQNDAIEELMGLEE